VSHAARGGAIKQDNYGAGFWPASVQPGRLHPKGSFTGIQGEADVDEEPDAFLLETTGNIKADGCSRSW
jgi:hypothetical protein